MLLPYATTESALIGMTEVIAKLVIEHGIRFDAVAPGPVWTPFIPSSFTRKNTKSSARTHCLGVPHSLPNWLRCTFGLQVPKPATSPPKFILTVRIYFDLDRMHWNRKQLVSKTEDNVLRWIPVWFIPSQ